MACRGPGTVVLSGGGPVGRREAGRRPPVAAQDGQRRGGDRSRGGKSGEPRGRARCRVAARAGRMGGDGGSRRRRDARAAGRRDSGAVGDRCDGGHGLVGLRTGPERPVGARGVRGRELGDRGAGVAVRIAAGTGGRAGTRGTAAGRRCGRARPRTSALALAARGALVSATIHGGGPVAVRAGLRAPIGPWVPAALRRGPAYRRRARAAGRAPRACAVRGRAVRRGGRAGRALTSGGRAGGGRRRGRGRAGRR